MKTKNTVLCGSCSDVIQTWSWCSYGNDKQHRGIFKQFTIITTSKLKGKA